MVSENGDHPFEVSAPQRKRNKSMKIGTIPSFVVVLGIACCQAQAQINDLSDRQTAQFQQMLLADAARAEQTKRAIAEVEPYLCRTKDGYLALSLDAPVDFMSKDAQALAEASLAQVNAMVESGEYTLTKLLSWEPINGGGYQTFANGNWLRTVSWWGYEAGIDTWRVQTLKQWMRDITRITRYLRNFGYGAVVHYLAQFVKVYATYMDWVDGNGGRRGVVLTATWANAFLPWCTAQR